MKVEKAKDRTYIEGTKAFGPNQYASSVHGCQATVLQAVGEPITYDELICLGGFAFRIQVHEQMCPSAGHPCCGFMCIEQSNRASPWRMELFENMGGTAAPKDQPAFEQEACAAIKESIDRCAPVHYGCEEDGLIIGYADEGRRWWCLHPYYKNGNEAFWHDQASGFAGGKWPWGIVVYTEPKPSDERLPETELVLAALRLAKSMWEAEGRDAYLVGDAGYAHWLQWLHDVDTGRIAEPQRGMQGNGWCFDVLIHSRRIAAHWLAAKADLFNAAATESLRKAAGHYDRIVEDCLSGLSCPWDLAPGPQRAADWTSEMRMDQIARLKSARTQDQSAINAIAQALNLIESQPSKSPLARS